MSSFGADERRCKRGIIATCYYLFVGRLVTRLGQPALPPGRVDKGERVPGGGVSSRAGRAGEYIWRIRVRKPHRAVVVVGRAIRV